MVDRRTTSEKDRHQYPEVVAGTILYLKQLYPAIHHWEFARIVQRKFGYRTNHHTIKAFLERNPIPVQLPLPVTHFRYLVRIGGDQQWVYSLPLLEGYSRKILAGMAAEHQEVVAVLQLLNAALVECGAPEGVVFTSSRRVLERERRTPPDTAITASPGGRPLPQPAPVYPHPAC